MLIIISSMPTSAVYRVMSERIIMFVKIMNRFFGGASFEVLTAGRKNFVIVKTSVKICENFSVAKTLVFLVVRRL